MGKDKKGDSILHEAAQVQLNRFGMRLSAASSDTTRARAGMWGKSFEASAKRRLEKAQGKVDDLELRIFNVMDINVSEDLQNANRVGTFDSDAMTDSVFNLEYELTLAKLKLEAAKATFAKYC